jgi:hypothetical protein
MAIKQRLLDHHQHIKQRIRLVQIQLGLIHRSLPDLLHKRLRVLCELHLIQQQLIEVHVSVLGRLQHAARLESESTGF